MSDDTRGAASLVAAITIWGATFALSKPALRHLAPSELAFLRQAFGLPPLLWLAWRTRSARLPLRHLLPLCATGMVGYYLFTNLGLDRASASVGALVQALAPALIATGAVAFLGERPTRRSAAGIGLALAGAAVLAWRALEVESALGLLFLVLSVASWAAYTVIGRHLGDRYTAVQASVLPVCLSVGVFAFGPLFESWQPARPGSVAFAAGLGFFGSGVAYVLWSYGIARVPAARAGVYTNLVPVVALLIAWLGLGDSLTPRQALGGAVVIAGAVLASTRAGAAVVLAVLVLALAGCGSRSQPSASEVVREWSAAIQADDDERAASLFAPDAGILQGDRLTTLHTHADAVRWNARLPCAGRVVALKQRGSSATATFRLGDRKHRRCGDPPGAEAIAVFVVEDGKIILWAQIGSQVALSH